MYVPSYLFHSIADFVLQLNYLVSCQCETIDPDDVDKIVKTVDRALSTYGTLAMKEMIQNCMSQDLSWKVCILSQ